MPLFGGLVQLLLLLDQLAEFYHIVIMTHLDKEKTREDVVREVRAFLDKEMLELSLNVASSPFMGTNELYRRCYLEALSQLKAFLGEPDREPKPKAREGLSPHASLKETEEAVKDFLGGDLSKEALQRGIEALSYLLETSQ